MVNAHLTRKMPNSVPYCGIFKPLGDVDLNYSCHIVTIPKLCSV